MIPSPASPARSANNPKPITTTPADLKNSGAAGIRTRVQRKNQITFYMLSFSFSCQQKRSLRNELSSTYSLFSHSFTETSQEPA